MSLSSPGLRPRKGQRQTESEAEQEKQGTLDLTEFPPGQAHSMRTLSLIFSEWKTEG